MIITLIPNPSANRALGIPVLVLGQVPRATGATVSPWAGPTGAALIHIA